MLDYIGLYLSTSRPGILHPPVPCSKHIKVPPYKIISSGPAESPVLKTEDTNTVVTVFTLSLKKQLSHTISVC